MVGNPSLGELVEFVELGRGVALRCVAHVDPVDNKPLDLVTGEVTAQFLNAPDELFDVEPFCGKTWTLPFLEKPLKGNVPFYRVT